MASFHITGIETGTISKDRTKFEINLRTDQGPLELTISAGHLDALVTSLQGLEYHASLMDPKQAAPGEAGQIRAEILDSYQIGNGTINGIPSVFLGLKCFQVFRWFALDREKAMAIQQSLENEIPKLQTEAGLH